MFEIQSQNQLGALPETPDKGNNKTWRDLCVYSHVGKLGPILQELMPAYSSWKGGTQLEFTLKNKGV